MEILYLLFRSTENVHCFLWKSLENTAFHILLRVYKMIHCVFQFQTMSESVIFIVNYIVHSWWDRWINSGWNITNVSVEQLNCRPQKEIKQMIFSNKLQIVLLFGCLFMVGKGKSYKHPCIPFPCGPGTQCFVSNSGKAPICKCKPGLVPKPNPITGCGRVVYSYRGAYGGWMGPYTSQKRKACKIQIKC